MLLFPDHWHLGYEEIKRDCQSSEEGKSALLLCNADVDAIAAARILSYMLRSDNVHYQLLPCTNYAMLNKHLEQVQLETVSAIVLLNFGASRNLHRLFEDHEELTQETKIFVMDCRRPVHLANVHAGDNVVVFMDGTQAPDNIPSDGDNLSGNESSSSEEDDDSSDDEDDSDDDSEDEKDQDDSEEEAEFDDIVDASGKKVEQQPADYDGEDEAEDNPQDSSRRSRDAQDEQEDAGSPKRQRTDPDGSTDVEESDPDTPPSKQETISPRELHRQRRERLRSYYSSGSFFGSPAAFIAHHIATQLRFGDQGDLLWLACVGVTDAYLQARVDMVGYTELAMALRQNCLKLFPSEMYDKAINTVYAEDLLGSSGGDKTKITFSDNGRIVAENDYRFFLLRHSSLLESMVHSDFVSTRLQVWTKKGMHKLQELLAKMGYPLEECKQPFAFMKPSLRRRLHEKIMDHAEVSVPTGCCRTMTCDRFLTQSLILLDLGIQPGQI